MDRTLDAVQRSKLTQARTIHRGAQVALPLMVLCHGNANPQLLTLLRGDARFELYVTRELTSMWVSFAQRTAAGLLALNTREPLAALVYARTAGIRGRIMLTLDRHHRRELAELEDLGGVTCLTVPFACEARDQIMSVLEDTRSPAMVEPSSRLLLDPIGRVIHYRDTSVKLSQREFALLHCLSQQSGRVVSVRDILNYVWDNASTLRSPQIVEFYVCQLRRKMQRIGLGGAIRTVRGYGYALICG